MATKKNKPAKKPVRRKPSAKKAANKPARKKPAAKRTPAAKKPAAKKAAKKSTALAVAKRPAVTKEKAVKKKTRKKAKKKDTSTAWQVAGAVGGTVGSLVAGGLLVRTELLGPVAAAGVVGTAGLAAAYFSEDGSALRYAGVSASTVSAAQGTLTWMATKRLEALAVKQEEALKAARAQPGSAPRQGFSPAVFDAFAEGKRAVDRMGDDDEYPDDGYEDERVVFVSEAAA